jgi:hypothetical protein
VRLEQLGLVPEVSKEFRVLGVMLEGLDLRVYKESLDFKDIRVSLGFRVS